MRAVDVIRKKRDGEALSAAEIDGGAGIDTCHALGFITGVFNCEHTV